MTGKNKDTSSAALATLDEFAEDLRRQVNDTLLNMGFSVPPGLDARDSCVAFFKVLGRTISMRSRTIKRSAELRARTLTPYQTIALHTIEAESLAGDNLNHRLTRQFWNADFNDFLLNDWNIHHLHIGPPGMGPKGLSGGTSELLYVIVRRDEIYFIDLLDHRAFAEQALMEIVHANWPEIIAPYRMQADLYFGSSPTADERAQARKAGLTIPLQVADGTGYWPPGGGQSTSRDNSVAVGHAYSNCNRVARFHAQCSNHLNEIVRQFRVSTSTEPIQFRLHVDFSEPAQWRLHLKEHPSGQIVTPSGFETCFSPSPPSVRPDAAEIRRSRNRRKRTRRSMKSK